MAVTMVFPSEFAKRLARSVKLHPIDLALIRDKEKKANAVDEMFRMKEFQQMSLYNSFEESMIIYLGIKLTKEQTAMLKIIHKSTGPWAKGFIAENLLGTMGLDSKATTENSKVLLDSLDGGLTEADMAFINGIMTKDKK